MHSASDLQGSQAYSTAVVLPFNRAGEPVAATEMAPPMTQPRPNGQNPALVKTCNLVIMAIIALPFVLAAIALLRRLI